MSDSTIANLASGSPVLSTDVLPIQRGNQTLKAQVSDLALGPFVDDAITVPPQLGAMQNSSTVDPNVAGGGPNKVAVFRWILTRNFNVVSAEVSVEALHAGSSAYLGIYTYNGLAGGNLIGFVVFDGSSTGFKLVSFSPQLSLKPGAYWVALGADDATGTLHMTGNAVTDGIWGRWEAGVAQNSISGGVMPATLGTITQNILGSPFPAGLKSNSVIG